MFLLSYNTYSLYVIGLYNYSYNTVFLMLYYIIVFVNNTQGYDFFFIAGEKTKKASKKVTPAAAKEEPALTTVPAGATVAAAAKELALTTVPASTGDDPSNPSHIEATDVPKKTSELLNDASQGDALLTIEGAEVSPATQSDLRNVRADIEESMDNGKKPFNLLDGTKPSEALETIKGVFGDLSSVYFPL